VDHQQLAKGLTGVCLLPAWQSFFGGVEFPWRQRVTGPVLLEGRLYAACLAQRQTTYNNPKFRTVKTHGKCKMK